MENFSDTKLLPKSASTQLLEKAQEVEAEKTPLLVGIKTRRKKLKLKKFYATQADLVRNCQKDLDHLEESGTEFANVKSTPMTKRRMEELLAKFIFGLNLVLLAAKIMAAYLSGSLSVISTVIDSAVDLASAVVIWITVRAIENHNPYEYPRGRSRLEPLAVVIVSIIMGVANIQMIIQSVQSVIENRINPQVDIPTVAILVTGTVIKIFLMIICYRVETSNGSVLALDQRNDIITNIVALACAAIGDKLWLYADPLGAILVSTFIAGSWFYMAAGQVPILTGKSASPEFVNRIIKVVVEHDPRINCLDVVFVYHFGTKFLVEVHVVLDSHMTLKESHDISSSLQTKLQRLPYVERAFVHCDYELDGDDYP